MKTTMKDTLVFVNDANSIDVKNLTYSTVLVVPITEVFNCIRVIKMTHPTFSHMRYEYYPDRHQDRQPPSTKKKWVEFSILKL